MVALHWYALLQKATRCHLSLYPWRWTDCVPEPVPSFSCYHSHYILQGYSITVTSVMQHIHQFQQFVRVWPCWPFLRWPQNIILRHTILKHPDSLRRVWFTVWSELSHLICVHLTELVRCVWIISVITSDDSTSVHHCCSPVQERWSTLMQLQTYALHFLPLSHSFLLKIWDYLAERVCKRIWFGYKCGIKPM